MRTNIHLALGLALAIGSSGCGASTQMKVGGVLVLAGLGGVGAGVGVAAGECSPSPEFCRSISPARAEVGFPILGASVLVLIAGASLMLSAKDPAAVPAPPLPAPVAPRRSTDWPAGL